MSLTLAVLQEDIDLAIKEYSDSKGDISITVCCPIFQAAKRCGLNPRTVGCYGISAGYGPLAGTYYSLPVDAREMTGLRPQDWSRLRPCEFVLQQE